MTFDEIGALAKKWMEDEKNGLQKLVTANNIEPVSMEIFHTALNVQYYETVDALPKPAEYTVRARFRARQKVPRTLEARILSHCLPLPFTLAALTACVCMCPDSRRYEGRRHSVPGADGCGDQRDLCAPQHPRTPPLRVRWRVDERRHVHVRCQQAPGKHKAGCAP